MKHAVIYVAGLGDHRSGSQRAAIRLWRIYGVKSEMVLMNWLIKEPFVVKQRRLLDRVDALRTAGYTVSLVGVSAGASVVVNTFAMQQTKIHRVVCVCGKLRSPQTIGFRTYEYNPAFGESMELLQDNLDHIALADRSRILSIRPLADGTVSPADTVIEGATAVLQRTSGHVMSIGLAITVFSWRILRFIKRT